MPTIRRVSSPINVLLFEGENWTHFRARWGADWLQTVLLWGPEYTMAFCRAYMNEVSRGEYWQHDGGAIIDVSRKKLLFHSGGDESIHIDARRALLAVLNHTWGGWHVEWESLGALSRYLARSCGLTEEQAVACFNPESDDLWPIDVHEFGLDEPSRWLSSVLSVRRADGSLRFLVADDDRPPVCKPVKLIPRWYRRDVGTPSLDLSTIPDCIVSGAHMDLAARTIDVWNASRIRYEDRYGNFPSYRIINHEDAFEQHLAICGHALRFFPQKDPEVLMRGWYDTMLGFDFEYYGAPPVDAALRQAVLQKVRLGG